MPSARTWWLFTTSPKGDGARRLGADEVVVSKNADEMAAHAGSFHFILNTVAAPRSRCLHRAAQADGTMVLVGVPAEPHPPPVVNLISAGAASPAR